MSRKQKRTVNRRRGYAEVASMELAKRQKTEKAKKWTFNACALVIFIGLVSWVTIEVFLFFNGTIGG